MLNSLRTIIGEATVQLNDKTHSHDTQKQKKYKKYVCLLAEFKSFCSFIISSLFFYLCPIKCVLNINKASSNSKKMFWFIQTNTRSIYSQTFLSKTFSAKTNDPQKQTNHLCTRLCTAIRKLHQTRSCFLYKNRHAEKPTEVFKHA